MTQARRVKLFRAGKSQAVRIPPEFAFPGREALIRRHGSGLMIEPVGKPSLLETLAALEATEGDFPDIDEGLQALRDVEI